jgi:hypothetical protein
MPQPVISIAAYMTVAGRTAVNGTNAASVSTVQRLSAMNTVAALRVGTKRFMVLSGGWSWSCPSN